MISLIITIIVAIASWVLFIITKKDPYASEEKEIFSTSDMLTFTAALLANR